MANTMFTPLTTASPAGMGADTGKLDEAIGLVQNLIQQRQQSKEQAFRGEQMQRQRQGWQQQDEETARTESQNQLYTDLAKGGRAFTTDQLNLLALDGWISGEQAQTLIPLATDYVSPAARQSQLAELIGSGQVTDVAGLNRARDILGVDETSAYRVWNEYQQAARATAGAGGAGGGGTGRAANGDTTTNVEAKMARLNALYTEAGMRLPSLPALQANAEHFDEALTVINNAQTALNSARLKVGGVLQTGGRIYTGTNTASFREIPGYAGYVVRVDSEGDIDVEKNGRRITINTDPKAIELANMLSGATASDLVALTRARTAYREALRSERDRLNRLQGGTNLLDEERQ